MRQVHGSAPGGTGIPPPCFPRGGRSVVEPCPSAAEQSTAPARWSRDHRAGALSGAGPGNCPPKAPAPRGAPGAWGALFFRQGLGFPNGRLLGPRSSFSPELESLRSSADRLLPGFSGATGRHRLAKGLELGGRCAGVLTMAHRYENTTAILELTGALDGVPHFHLAMDHDWDEAARSRLRSFLYDVS